MLTGFKGVKYGLVVPKTEPKAGPRKTLAAFAEDESDDEQQVARAIERQAQRKQTDSKVAKIQEAALAEDPTVFDYDSHFDNIQEQREGPKAAERKARKSRYIEGLLDKAKERQKEQDIVYERRLLNERQAEDHLFGDKERFVTAAYKRKLEEDKKWLQEEALREKVEAEQDVRKRGHMGDFYRNLLTNNVAFGTGNARKESISQSEAKPESAGDPFSDDPRWAELRKAREAYEERLASQNEAKEECEQPEARTADSTEPSNLDRTPDAASTPLVAVAQGDPEVVENSAADLQEAEPVISREDKAAAARERYLARKRKAPA